MKLPNPQFPQIDKLRGLYLALPETTKRDLCETLYKVNPKQFEEWFKACKVKGYGHAKAVVKRPAPTGRQLDEGLLGQTGFFVAVVGAYVRHREDEGLCKVLYERLKDTAAVALSYETFSRMVDEMPPEASKHPAPPPNWDLFARTYFHTDYELFLETARVLLKEATATKTESSVEMGVASDGPKESQNSFVGQNLNDYRQAIIDLEEGLAAAKRLAPLDKASLQAKIAELATKGRDLLEHLSEKAKALGEKAPSIESLDDYREKLGELEKRLGNHASMEALRQRLVNLLKALRLLEDVGSRTAKRRQAIAEAKAAAEQELAQVQQNQEPPVLPGDGEGLEWLQCTFALPPDELQRRLDHLAGRSLVKLAAFIEEAERWEIFEPIKPGALGAKSEPQTVSTSSESHNLPEKTLADSKPKEISPQLVDVPVTTQVVAMQEEHKRDHVENSTSNQPTTEQPKGAVAIRAIANHSGVTSSPIENAPPGASLAKGTSTPQGAKQRINGPTDAVIATSSAFPEIVLGFTATEAGTYLIRDVARAWSDHAELTNLPSQLWELLHIQPVLLDPHSQEAQRTIQWLKELGEWTPGNRIEATIGWAAAMVPAFVGASSEAYAVLHNVRQFLPPGHLADSTRDTLGLFERVPNCSTDSIRSGSLIARWEQEAQRQRKALIEACDNARHKRTSYQKATRIWQRLNGADGRLRKIAQLAQLDGRIEDLQAATKQLADGDRIIDQVTREVVANNAVQIEGKARQQLHAWLDEFAKAVEQLIRHLRSQPKDQNYITTQLQAFLRQATPRLENLSHLPITSDWQGLVNHFTNRTAVTVLSLLKSEKAAGTRSSSLDEKVGISRRLIPSLEVNPETGEIGMHSSHELRDVLRPNGLLSLEDAVKARIKNGDIGNARLLLTNIEPGPKHETLIQQLDEALTTWDKTVTSEINSLRSSVVNARALLVIDESDGQRYLQRLTSLEAEVVEQNNFGSIKRRMAAITSELDQKMRSEAAKLRASMKDLRVSDPEVRKRIEVLLDRNDLATVREYHTRLSAGNPLPPVYTDETEARFGQVQEDTIRKGFTAGGGFDGLILALRNKQTFAGLNFGSLSPQDHEGALRWLEKGWQALKKNRTDRAAIRSFFEGLEFIVKSDPIPSGGVFEVLTTAIDERELCPIPSYGSLAAGLYSVAIFSSPSDPALMLPNREGACIVLALYPLAPGVRQQFARHCREKRKRALLVDDCVVAFLSRQDKRRMRSFFRATFPFTWIDPYQPTTSHVPPEMFFGRSDALDALLDFDKQRCFVFGGRQLGKTALLREVERRAHHPEQESYALWLDLQSLEFGKQTEPKEIWVKLEPAFRQKLKGFSECYERNRRISSTAVRIQTALMQWLDSVARRKLLLLLDEGDLFLDSDGANDFAETRKLKALMDDSKRRIKVVFAGLHNVQRSTIQPNHPLAHLGKAITIGAFSANDEWMEAYSLVVGPLAALGYRFESPDLPSRVLTACNFYPGLIQQFGHRLLDRLRLRPRTDWPCEITAGDVDAVANDDELRRFMIERFNLTLQLDPRYHYLAYLYALNFYRNPKVVTDGLTFEELRDLALSYQPNVFARITRETFATLIEEMVALGVFQANEHSRRVSLRNTNVLRFLGSESDIENAVQEEIQEVRYDYKAQTCRGAIIKGAQNKRRRWLPRIEENRLFEPNSLMSYISALPLAVSSTLAESMAASASNLNAHFYDISISRAIELENHFKNLSERDGKEGINLVLIRTTNWKEAEEINKLAIEFAGRARKVKHFSLVIELPSNFSLSGAGAKFLSGKDVPRYYARRWEREFVGPWLQECESTPTPAHLDQLMQLTDGWPELLVEFVDLHKEHRSWDKAFDGMGQRLVERLKLPWEYAGGRLGLDTSKDSEGRHFLELMRELSGNGSATFSIDDLGVAAEMFSFPPEAVGQWVEQAEKHDLLARTDRRYVCTPFFARILSAL